MRLLISFLLTIPFFCSSQEGLKEYVSNDFDRIYDSDTIVFYGLDFFNFGLLNPDKVGQEEKLAKFFPAWMSSVNEEYDKDRLALITRRKIIRNLKPVQQRFKKIDSDWITFEKNKFGIDTIKSVIRSYQLKEIGGIGLVLIIENFNKEKENARINFTFFDVSSREILWSIEVKGSAFGAGMTKHWSNAINDSFSTFKTAYHIDYRKTHKKKRKERKLNK